MVSGFLFVILRKAEELGSVRNALENVTRLADILEYLNISFPICRTIELSLARNSSLDDLLDALAC